MKHDNLGQNVDFRKLWLGKLVSAFGSQISSMAIYYVALLVLKAGPEQLGWLTAAGSLPYLFVSLFAGVWVDRLRRRPLLIAADLGRAVLLASIPLTASFGLLTFGQLLLVAPLVGTLTILFNVAEQAYLPSVVERGQLVAANSRLAASDAAAEVGGPAVGGVLVSLLTAPFTILLDVASFVFSAACFWLVRKPEPAAVLRDEQSNLWREIGAGLRLVGSNQIVRAITLSMATSALFGNFIGTLYTYYAIHDLGLDPAAVGVVIGVGGASALLGTLLVGPLSRRYPLGKLMIGCMVAHRLVQLTIPLAGGPPPLAFAIMLIGQIADVFGTVYMINEVSLRQSVVPDHLLGRVNASVNFLVGGLVPVGALLGGWLGQHLGARPTLWLATLGLLAATLWIIFSPIRNLVEQPGLVEEKQVVPATFVG